MSHRNRMNEIGFWALPREGTSEYEDVLAKLKAQREKNPALVKAIKEVVKNAEALTAVQNKNGSGFPLDKMIREYIGEYNSRSFNHSLHAMPTSFNIMEAFSKFLPESAIFKIRKEKDFLVSYLDYLDYVTSEGSGSDAGHLIELTEEGVIYSFNGTHDPRDLSFTCADSKEFCVAGMSMVRHGGELNVMMLAGMVCDIEQETKDLREGYEQISSFPHKEAIQPDESLKLEAVALQDGLNLWKTVVLCRLDLNSDSLDVRYVAHDCGNSYRVYTDNVAVFLNDNGEFPSSVIESAARKSMEDIKGYQSLFEFIKISVGLMAFIESKEDLIKIERHATRLKAEEKDKYTSRMILRAPKSEIKFYRNVSCVSFIETPAGRMRTFYSPGFQVETTGYWKQIPPDKIGLDKLGQAIHGRTWVEKTLAWVEQSERSAPITVGSGINKQSGNNPGFIYVMRCAAHGRDVFKVGLTARSSYVRSQELTSHTSAPDQFLIVEEWEVGDCKLAEKIIHERLDSYRINPKREFFKAPYKDILKVVDAVVDELRL